MKPQNNMLQLMGLNLKRSVVNANRLLADALQANPPKEEILIKFYPVVRVQSKQQVCRGSKRKQIDLRPKTMKSNKRVILEVINTILNHLGPVPKERCKSTGLMHTTGAATRKQSHQEKTTQQAQKPLKKLEKSALGTHTNENFTQLGQKLKLFPAPNRCDYTLGLYTPAQSPNTRIQKVYSKMEMPTDVATICELDRKVQAFRKLFVQLVVKHPHLRKDALKIAQENCRFKDLQLGNLLPSIFKIKTPIVVSNAYKSPEDGKADELK